MNGAIIFDFDGVIINSLEVQRKAFYTSFRMVSNDKLDELPSFQEFLLHSGDSLQNIFKAMNLPLEMVGPYREISSKSMNLVKIVDGMIEVLNNVKQLKLLCGLCTGKDRYRTQELLKHFDIEKYFQYVICSDDVINPKPHPESLNTLIKEMQVDKDKVVMVGDGRNDVICARNAHVKSVAVAWGDTPIEILFQENPDYFVHTPFELKQCIEGVFVNKRV